MIRLKKKARRKVKKRPKGQPAKRPVGRPPTGTTRSVISLSLRDDTIAALRRTAKKGETSRLADQLLRQALKLRRLE